MKTSRLPLWIITVLFSLGFQIHSRAEDQPYIAVGDAKARKTVIAIPGFATPAVYSSALQQVHKIVQEDLSFIDLFQFLGSGAYPDQGANMSPGSFDFKEWKSVGAEYLVKAKAESHERGLALETWVYQVSQGQTVLSKRYISAVGDTRTLAHTMANDIVTAITGLPGIFLTKIAMVCERGYGLRKTKELFVIDFDGKNPRQITHHHSTVVGPTWSPDGTRIAYSAFVKNRSNVKNVNLFEFDFKTSSIRLLSDRSGNNTGAAYHPDGRRIALTMNFLDRTNSEIFVFDPSSKTVSRLTKSAAQDVDPFWSPDGKQLLFVSDRNGPSMVYRMNADGSDVQRLTFAGSNNASPVWSPRGGKIVFASWIARNTADIFIMNEDGTNMERLTKAEGSNEDPHFSPDGNLIAFSSSRGGSKNIYIMNVDGTFQKRVTYGLGNCTSPRWSNPVR